MTTSETGESGTAGSRTSKVRIWDLPTRLFHWALTVSIAGAVGSQYLGEPSMVWHFRFGYATLTLVLFRLIWGVLGTHHARFVNFVRGPMAIVAYLTRRTPSHDGHPGHNPLGALSVLAMLGAVWLQALTGLFANDDIAEQGPLARFIDKALSDQISSFHSHIGIKLIYLLVALHVAAILYYLVRKRVNLVHPMVSGDKHGLSHDHAVADGWPERIKALACLLCCIGLIWCLVNI